MKITRQAVAGTLESSDILVEVAPSQGVQIQVESIVLHQYGDVIEATIRQVLEELSADNVAVRVNDRGALDCTIRARVETALRRGGEETEK